MVYKIKKKDNRFKKSGFVLLYAILTATVVAAIGATFISIITRQITISMMGRDSQMAFYAADSAYTCFSEYSIGRPHMLGYFWERFVFPPGEFRYTYLQENDVVRCGEYQINLDAIVWEWGGGTPYENGDECLNDCYRKTIDPIKVFFDNGTCALVNIGQGPDLPDEVKQIEVIGYNTSDRMNQICPVYNNKTVARSIIYW